MSQPEISIADASNDQLLHFAQVVLNLAVSGTDSRNKLIAQIKAVHDRDTIPVGGATAANAAVAKPSNPDLVSSVDIETERAKAQAARAARQLGDVAAGPMHMQGQFDVPHFQIELMKSAGPDGDAPVEVWVNGRSMVIPRATRIEVPGPFLDVLHNAVHIEYQQVERYGDNGREIETTSHESPRYNVRVLRGPYYPDKKSAA